MRHLAYALAAIVGVAPGAHAAPIAFALPADYATGPFPFGVTLADLNGDDLLDVAVTNPDGFTDPRVISVLFNAGDGTFAAPAPFSTGETPRAIAAGDLDADGDADLVVGYQVGDDRLGILRNDGLGGFAAPEFLAPISGRADAVYILDLDGDDDPDILVGQAGGDEIVVVRNDGGAFAPPVSFGGISSAYVLHLSVGDVDGDGDPDAIVGRSLSVTAAAIYVNDGDGSFAATPALPFVTSGYAGNDIGDVDGDGDLDLVFVNEVGNHVLWARNVGWGAFVSGGVFPCEADTQLGTPVRLADLDGDGRADAVVPGANTYRVATLRSAGATGFEAPEVHALGGIARKIAAGDLEGDGDLDLAGTVSLGGFVSVLLNQSANATAVAPEPPARGILSFGPVRPNPVRAWAAIPFELAESGPVRVAIVDLQGRRVRSLADGVFTPGRHSVNWDARDARGAAAAPGVYFARLEAGTVRRGIRIAVVR